MSRTPIVVTRARRKLPPSLSKTALPMMPPTMLPTMPRSRVAPRLMRSRPGTSSRASAPSTMPMASSPRMSKNTSASRSSLSLGTVCPPLEAAETDLAVVGLGDLEVGDLVDRYDDAVTLLVHEAERPAVDDRLVQRLGDLLGRLLDLDHELAGRVHDPDLDLHRYLRVVR